MQKEFAALSIDVGYDPSTSPSRPRALVEHYRASLYEEQAHRSAPAPQRRPRPFPRLSMGQVVRAALLMIACLGLAQLVQVGQASAEKSPAPGQMQVK
ncbi:hypothetical protein LG047_02005 [Methylocystis sp. WRRC1]|uniref:hypothetical protein n=1 Tax=Methylocystis sp. WRRC1 TaxID=1732014 RepID=UPI001D134AF2|nr:hypothetical protein [Methylocystis sp. WRRC1]MCC3244104.1 hypothetical protein [Methylocystis sp. WRRC1]